MPNSKLAISIETFQASECYNQAEKTRILNTLNQLAKELAGYKNLSIASISEDFVALIDAMAQKKLTVDELKPYFDDINTHVAQLKIPMHPDNYTLIASVLITIMSCALCLAIGVSFGFLLASVPGTLIGTLVCGLTLLPAANAAINKSRFFATKRFDAALVESFHIKSSVEDATFALGQLAQLNIIA